MEPFALVVSEVEQDAAGAVDGRSSRRVRAVGELDMSSAAELTSCLDALIDDGATLVSVDASDVTFLDSTGLRVLVDASVRLEQVGGVLVIDPMSNGVHRVLEITGLLDRYRPR